MSEYKNYKHLTRNFYDFKHFNCVNSYSKQNKKIFKKYNFNSEPAITLVL